MGVTNFPFALTGKTIGCGTKITLVGKQGVVLCFLVSNSFVLYFLFYLKLKFVLNPLVFSFSFLALFPVCLDS